MTDLRGRFHVDIMRIADGPNVLDNINENFDRLRELLGPLGGTGTNPFQAFAYLVGGILLEDIEVTTTEDLAVPNPTDRIPSIVFHSVDLDGAGGLVSGAPSSAGSLNTNDWTVDTIYLRSTVDSRYSVILL